MNLRDFIEAIRKNGVKQIQGDLFSVNYEARGDEDEWISVEDDVLSYIPDGPEVRNVKVIGACALGQAVLNLKKETSFPDDFLEDVNYRIDQFVNNNTNEHFNAGWFDNHPIPFTERVVTLNDREKKSLDEIADILLVEFADVLEVSIS